MIKQSPLRLETATLDKSHRSLITLKVGKPLSSTLLNITKEELMEIYRTWKIVCLCPTNQRRPTSWNWYLLFTWRKSFLWYKLSIKFNSYIINVVCICGCRVNSKENTIIGVAKKIDTFKKMASIRYKRGILVVRLVIRRF